MCRFDELRVLFNDAQITVELECPVQPAEEGRATSLMWKVTTLSTGKAILALAGGGYHHERLHEVRERPGGSSSCDEHHRRLPGVRHV